MASDQKDGVLMNREEINKVLAGVIACDKSGSCEDCPYAPAAENCGKELERDMLQMAVELPNILDWAQRSIWWLGRNDPDALITMVDQIGWPPESLSIKEREDA